MLNQPPTTPAPSSTEPETPAPTDATQPSSGEPAKPYSTVEEAETHWKNRLSGKDKAHNAAEQALRDEIAQLRAQQAASAGQSGTQGTEDPAVKAYRERAEAAETKLKAEAERNAMLARKSKYPALAASGVADAVFAISDEATLARLNALADDNASGGDSIIAPTSPSRKQPAPSKPINEMSKEELELHLKAQIEAGAHLPRG